MVTGSYQAGGSDHNALCISSGLRAVLEPHWPGSVLGPPDFVRCRSGLGLLFSFFCISGTHGACAADGLDSYFEPHLMLSGSSHLSLQKIHINCSEATTTA